MSIEGAGRICRRNVLIPEDFSSIQLVFGHAGDGKTHYIMQQLSQSAGPLTIAVNEAFTPLSAIKKLKSLPLVKDCAIFFNFTILPHQVLLPHWYLIMAPDHCLPVCSPPGELTAGQG